MEALRPFLVETPIPGTGNVSAPNPLSWPTLFGNDRPVEIEIGFGKGLFLIHEAARRPQVNFLGIEIVRKYQLFTATRLAKRGLTNVRVACADARIFLTDRVVPSSVQTIHVYFPDPWWKTRHHKRRVFTGAFAARCAEVLQPGGQLLLATDVEAYAAMEREVVDKHTNLRELPPPVEKPPEHDLDYLTNFERKFRKQGKPICRMAFERMR
jgi:tRNA (guanine-N7-)-methyltransferase